jgi:hypothetical protein
MQNPTIKEYTYFRYKFWEILVWQEDFRLSRSSVRRVMSSGLSCQSGRNLSEIYSNALLLFSG